MSDFPEWHRQTFWPNRGNKTIVDTRVSASVHYRQMGSANEAHTPSSGALSYLMDSPKGGWFPVRWPPPKREFTYPRIHPWRPQTVFGVLTLGIVL